MSIGELAKKIKDGDRRALAHGITLVESSRADHRQQAVELIEILRHSEFNSIRIGLTGAPGVGKSTFIENFGMMLINCGLRVMVLAVDPSSTWSGGSILGDKTRMEQLSREENAFIRPSPNKTYLGGVARRTREAVLLGQAAGYDITIIETVGVGQSETVVSELSDLFVLLIPPSGGDDLQGVKRGIMELADLVLINKADGDLKSAATYTCAEYAAALRLMRIRVHDPDGFPKAIAISAIEKHGLTDVWLEIKKLCDWRKNNGYWNDRRSSQLRHWFEQEIQRAFMAKLEEHEVSLKFKKFSDEVALGHINPIKAAEQMMTFFE
ncbi:MAG: methylmalonyl Co-A mutase-associated GTPase MeaB [Aestuariivita sp.]|nr:methylmalonyl Co-A mutase-associated GTPase MeaB [Aestuariivita sp.]